MFDDVDVRLFEIVKQQDSVMHNVSGELGVKTSLYLVFAAFVLSASIQLLNFVKDMNLYSARCAVVFCSLGAAIALLAGIALLGAALVRSYSIFPSQATAEWIEKLRDYKNKYPNETVEDPAKGLLRTMIRTVDANQVENEKKARW